MTVLTQAFAGAAGDPEMGPALYAALEAWSEMVTDAISRVLGDGPLASLVPAQLLGQTISALFLGIELMADLDPERAEVDALFDSLLGVAAMVELLIAGGLQIPEQ